MSVETATFLNELDPTKPDGSDVRSEGDNHLRLIKAVLKATFPNINGAVSVTDEQINSVVNKLDATVAAIQTLMSGQELPNLFLKAYQEKCIQAVGGAAYAIDCALANFFEVTLNQICVLSINNAPVTTGRVFHLTLVIKQDTNGSRLVTWPGTFLWPSGVIPTLSTGANKRDVVVASTYDSGASWIAMMAAQGI